MNDAIEAEVKPLAIRDETLPAERQTPEEAREWQEWFTAMKRAIMTPDDYELYDGKIRPKRSYYEKISVPLKISVQIISHNRYVEEGVVGYEVIARASFPDGRSRDGLGACDSTESRFASVKGRSKVTHDTAGTAQTRAENRAIEKLIGTGEVSYEEAATLAEQIRARHDRERRGDKRPAPPQPTQEENTELRRRQGLASIHALKDKRAIPDEEYRELLVDMFGDECFDAHGNPSSSMLSLPDLQAFYAALRKKFGGK